MSVCCTDRGGGAGGAVRYERRLPVKREYQFSGGAIHIHEDLLDERPDDALLQPRAGGWISPDRFQLPAELMEVLTSHYWTFIDLRTGLLHTPLDIPPLFHAPSPAAPPSPTDHPA